MFYPMTLIWTMSSYAYRRLIEIPLYALANYRGVTARKGFQLIIEWLISMVCGVGMRLLCRNNFGNHRMHKELKIIRTFQLMPPLTLHYKPTLSTWNLLYNHWYTGLKSKLLLHLTSHHALAIVQTKAHNHIFLVSMTTPEKFLLLRTFVTE